MKKQLIATCVLLLFILIPLHSYAKEEEGKRRSVMLVYDDSGSMRTSGNGPVDRWKYANYALQSFVGLLDRNDRFSYVAMSNPTSEIAISLEKRQEEMNQIRSIDKFKDTPFQSVVTGIEAMKRQIKGNESDEYWFIIVTDGAFNDLQVSNQVQYESNKKMMTDTLHNFIQLMNDNHISVHCLLITMESNISNEERQQMNTFKDIWKQTTNGMIFSSDGEDGIIRNVNEAAALIANRDPFSNINEVLKINSKDSTISFVSPFPMRRITVVQQGNVSNVVKLSDQAASLDGPYLMSAPQIPMLHGTVIHVSHRDGSVMTPGSYTLQLDKPIDSNQNVKVLVEPALDFTVHVYDKLGTELKESNGSPYAGSTVMIEAKPIDLPIQPSFYTATYIQNGKTSEMTWNEERKAFQLTEIVEEKPMRGNVQMSIKGFYQQTKEIRLTPVLKPNFTIQTATSNWKEDVSNLINSPPIILQPLLDGKPMLEQDVASLHSSISLDKHVNMEVKQQGSKLYVYPRPYFSRLFNFTETGLMKATIQLESEKYGKASVDIPFEVTEVSFWQRNNILFQQVLPLLFLFLFFVIVIVGWITRARFHKSACITFEFDQSFADEWIHTAEPEPLPGSWWKHYIGLPFRAERRTVQSITFIAKRRTKAVCIAKESQCEGMIIEGSILEREEVGIALRTIYPNETIMIDRGYGKETYKYECE
ncbi:vWA domain-containing protein [Ectobacillus polymachus]|uniref:vWA domain-containing protein n=1 Tax=Ectobacillus polymachus TaxID=1508806 RepID=UPI003A8429CC